MLLLNQGSDCRTRPVRVIPAEVRNLGMKPAPFSAVHLTNCGVIYSDLSLQASYPAFVMYTSLIYKNMTTPVYTTLKGVSAASSLL